VSDILSIPPADPKAAVKYRIALGAAIVLGVLIVLALIALIVKIMAGGHAGPPPPAVPVAAAKPARPEKPVSMTLAPGYKILSSDTQPGRLILHVRSEAQDEIDIIDLEDGHIISQIHASAPE
jgi:hypothetical protein